MRPSPADALNALPEGLVSFLVAVQAAKGAPVSIARMNLFRCMFTFLLYAFSFATQL